MKTDLREIGIGCEDRNKMAPEYGAMNKRTNFRVPYKQEMSKPDEFSLILQGNTCNSDKLGRSDHVLCRYVCVPSRDADQSATTTPRDWGQ